MRRFALGCLRYTPDRFGLMMVGDFLDAMAGYNEGEGERIKSIVEIVRTATTILRNTQPMEGGPLKPSDLWPLSWDKEVNDGAGVIVISDEEKERSEREMTSILDKMSHGNSNIKS
jgi:hypothetical protein